MPIKKDVVKWDGNISVREFPFIVAVWDVDGFHTYAASNHQAARDFASSNSHKVGFVYRASESRPAMPTSLFNVYYEGAPVFLEQNAVNIIPFKADGVKQNSRFKAQRRLFTQNDNLILLVGGERSGKTYRCKQIIFDTVAAGGKALAFDWHGDYDKLVEELGENRFTSIGGGYHAGVMATWLASQLASIVDLMPVDTVIAETDSYLNDDGLVHLLSIARRIRSYNGRLVITSQSLQPFTSCSGRELLAEVDKVVLLRLNEDDADEAVKLFRLSPQERSSVVRSPYGEACIIYQPGSLTDPGWPRR